MVTPRVGRAAHVEPAELPLDVLFGHLEQVRGELARLGPDLARHHGDRRARDRRGPRRVGAHAERRGVGVALLDEHVGGRDAQLVRDDLGPRRLVALALGLRAGPQDRLAGRVHPQLGGVEHLDAEDVVLAAVAGAERLGHRGDADAEQPPALGGPPPCPAGTRRSRSRPARCCRHLWYWPESMRKPNGVRYGNWSSRTRLTPAELGRVDAEVRGRGGDHALLEEHRLGDPERAPVGDAAGRLVGVAALRAVMCPTGTS